MALAGAAVQTDEPITGDYFGGELFAILDMPEIWRGTGDQGISALRWSVTIPTGNERKPHEKFRRRCITAARTSIRFPPPGQKKIELIIETSRSGSRGHREPSPGRIRQEFFNNILSQPRSSQDSTRFADGGEFDPLAALVVGVRVTTSYRFNTARTWT